MINYINRTCCLLMNVEVIRLANRNKVKNENNQSIREVTKGQFVRS